MGRLLRNMDYLIPIITIILIVLGLIIVESATHTDVDSLFKSIFFKKQILATLIGIVIIGINLLFDYRVLRDYAPFIYMGCISVLLIVLFFGQTIKGGQGWLNLGPVNFQPAELTKLALIIVLADLLAKNKYNIQYCIGLIIPLLYLLIPFGLIILQNDLGTALVLIAIFIGMIYVAGANPRFLLGTGLLIVLITVGWIAAHIYLEVPIPLKSYQLNRLLVLINPQLDPLNSGYNVMQSKIAIGSGGLWGKGLFAGTQNRLNFLPERHTDFIFSVLGEELGFVGAVTILLAYFIFIWRGIWIAKEAKDDFGRLLVIGILSMFTFHILENIGMTVGIMPVTGIPLPFLSYGGSSLLTNLIAVGLIINVNIRRKKIRF